MPNINIRKLFLGYYYSVVPFLLYFYITKIQLYYTPWHSSSRMIGRRPIVFEIQTGVLR